MQGPRSVLLPGFLLTCSQVQIWPAALHAGGQTCRTASRRVKGCGGRSRVCHERGRDVGGQGCNEEDGQSRSTDWADREGRAGPHLQAGPDVSIPAEPPAGPRAARVSGPAGDVSARAGPEAGVPVGGAG